MLTSILALILLLAARSSRPTLTSEDNGARIELNRGEEFELVLSGNPSTGYAWRVEEVSPVLVLIGEPDFQPGSDLVGAPGEYRFRFAAREPGTGLQQEPAGTYGPIRGA